MPHGMCKSCGKTCHGWALEQGRVCECGGEIETKDFNDIPITWDIPSPGDLWPQGLLRKGGDAEWTVQEQEKTQK